MSSCFFVEELERREIIDGVVNIRIWHHLDRAGLTVPFPIQDLYLHATDTSSPEEVQQQFIDQMVPVLRQIPEFSPLSDGDIQWLAQKAKLRVYGRGERIIRQGEEGVSLNIITDGKIDIVVRQTPDDDGKTVASLSRGRYFGERALITGEPVSADAVAVTDCQVYKIEKNALATILERNPEMVDLLSRRLEERENERREILGQSDLDAFDAMPARPSESGSLAARIRSFFQMKDEY
jgi:CRP-like cAMP-binding protein